MVFGRFSHDRWLHQNLQDLGRKEMMMRQEEAGLSYTSKWHQGYTSVPVKKIKPHHGKGQHERNSEISMQSILNIDGCCICAAREDRGLIPLQNLIFLPLKENTYGIFIAVDTGFFLKHVKRKRRRNLFASAFICIVISVYPPLFLFFCSIIFQCIIEISSGDIRCRT